MKFLICFLIVLLTSFSAQIHPLVAHFLRMDNERVISRYCHLYPLVKRETLEELLSYKPTHFRWSGADLFNVTEAKGYAPFQSLLFSLGCAYF